MEYKSIESCYTDKYFNQIESKVKNVYVVKMYLNLSFKLATDYIIDINLINELVISIEKIYLMIEDSNIKNNLCMFVYKKFKSFLSEIKENLKNNKSINNYYVFVFFIKFFDLFLINCNIKQMYLLFLKPESKYLDLFFSTLELSLKLKNQYDAVKISCILISDVYINKYVNISIYNIIFNYLKKKLLEISFKTNNIPIYSGIKYNSIINYVKNFEFNYNQIIKSNSLCNCNNLYLSK